VTTALRVKQAKLADLRPAPWNPRTISEFQLNALKASLETYGAVEPIVANADGTILGGHQRYEAATALGWPTFPTVYVDVDEATAKRLNVALNRISGDFDESALAKIVSEITSGPVELLDMGMAELEVRKLLMSLNVPPPAAFPEPSTETDHKCPSCSYEWNGPCR
jgi:ParB-like chromosome segregation protein Spo0J